MSSERAGLFVVSFLMIGGCGTVSGLSWRAVGKAKREIERMSPSLTAPAGLRAGQPARYQGRLEPGSEKLQSRDRGAPCVAYHTRVVALGGCDDDGCSRRETIFEERRGPAALLVRGERGYVSVALERWNDVTEKGKYRIAKRAPPFHGVTYKQPRFTPDEYLVEESLLPVGQPLFVAGVAGRLWDATAGEGGVSASAPRTPVREVLQDPALGRVELFRGEQRELIDRLRGRKRWSTVAAVVGAVLALLGVVVLIGAIRD